MLALGAASCASDDLDSGGDDSSGSGDKGKVVVSGQAFDEAALVASMYQLLLEKEGYTVEQKLVETRDQYLGELEKGNVQIAPEYTGGILDLLNSNANGADAEPITTSDAAESITAAKSLLDDAGITLLEPSAATDSRAARRPSTGRASCTGRGHVAGGASRSISAPAPRLRGGRAASGG